MIVNRQAKIGLFEKKPSINEKGLLIVNFNTQEKKHVEKYAAWNAKCISPDGEKIAITTKSDYKKAERTELIVMEHQNQQVLFSTHDYYVYDAAFNSKGDKILIVADKKKPFCYDLMLN